MGYPMSYLEFAATLLNLTSVLLITRQNIWTWPVGLAAVVLMGMLFYQIQLYSDFLEQVYYFFACIYGWWLWGGQNRSADTGRPKFSAPKWWGVGLLVTAVGGALLGGVVEQLHLLLPLFFPEPASYPYWDALTTAGSFVAMVLMARRRIECWIYWIIIDVIGVVLYLGKGVVLVALLYGIYLLLAVMGLINWLNFRGRRCGP